MMYFCLFTLGFFFIKMCSTSATFQNTNVTEIFVNGKNGSDIPSCGQKRLPCKTVSYAIGRILEENSTSGVVNLFPGIYEAESFKVDCGTNHLQKLVIQGIGTSEKVQVTLSTDIIKCDIIFNNIQWTSTSPSPVLLNLLIANVSIVNSIVTDLPFSIIGLGSSIKLWNATISNCVGYQPLLPLMSASGLTGFNSNIILNTATFSFNNAQLISAKEITAIHMEKLNFFSNNVTVEQILILIDRCQSVLRDSHFMNNSGSIIKMTQSTMANITGSVFGNNDVMSGSLLVVSKQVVLHIDSCSFSSIYGTSSGPVLRTEREASLINIQSSYFSCNRVNSSIHLPPIHSHSLTTVNCTNCTINPHCPVYCTAGSFVLEGVMCSPCPKGAYSTERVQNITTITCKRCSPGYYSSSLGSKTCYPCAKGTFSSKSGSTQCSPCKNDFMTSGEGESSCSRMTIGCIVLTVFVILLILIPLLLLAGKHLSTTTKRIGLGTKPKDFKILHEDVTGSVQ
ncbi:uncharacterized protein LOC116287005 [Actinia tenebrosa]|uniref:Uncharacterized protein LOC116287005 n=1 Tax=Actinia tenebrosa TaxID=6105 RepID=A0A6P8HAG1_ACTTE|nr:uncharacterized protein LOC116287005 [Actinia tenebrosa]